MKFTAPILLLFVITLKAQQAKRYGRNVLPAAEQTCKTVRDTLTGKMVYVNVDKLPQNVGGAIALNKCFLQLKADSIPDGYDGHFIIAFIVDTAGNISGERIVTAALPDIAGEIIGIAKSFRWLPAICNGRKVDMLYSLNWYIEVSEN